MNGNMINKEYIQTCIHELYSIEHISDNKRKVSLIECTLFIEDMFSIKVADKEICTENLGDAQALINFVQKKCGV